MNRDQLVFPSKSRDRSIESVLLSSGRLNEEDLAKINERRIAVGCAFEEAGKQLGLLSDSDITFARARRFEYPFPVAPQSKISKQVRSAHYPFSKDVEALRTIRSRILLSWNKSRSAGKAFAVVSSGAGEGRSVFAANVAILMSQLGARTALVDADLRRPRQHLLFGVENSVGLTQLLGGICGMECTRLIGEVPNLAVITAGALAPNPQELLSGESFGSMMDDLRVEFDVIVIDTPPLEGYADAEIVSARAGHAVVVSRRNKTGFHQLAEQAARLESGPTEILGSVFLE